MFDRVGNAHICHVGYRGTRNFVYQVGNLLMDQIGHHGPRRPGLNATRGQPGPAASGFGFCWDSVVYRNT